MLKSWSRLYSVLDVSISSTLTRAAEVVGHRVRPDLRIGGFDEGGHLERFAGRWRAFDAG